MRKILIVDDNRDIVDLVKNRLEGDNYEVIFAFDGDDGIKKAQQQKPDLIVMDIMMPKVQGGDAVRLLKSDEKTKHIPVLFLTALTANMLQGTSINVDGQSYKAIAKPFEPAKLLSEIRKLIGDD